MTWFWIYFGIGVLFLWHVLKLVDKYKYEDPNARWMNDMLGSEVKYLIYIVLPFTWPVAVYPMCRHYLHVLFKGD